MVAIKSSIENSLLKMMLFIVSVRSTVESSLKHHHAQPDCPKPVSLHSFIAFYRSDMSFKYSLSLSPSLNQDKLNRAITKNYKL